MGMMSEFKEFAMRGNVVDMAVGIVIGGAFGKIVSSFVNDVLMPPIGMALGNVDFSQLMYILKPAEGEVEAVAQVAGALQGEAGAGQGAGHVDVPERAGVSRQHAQQDRHAVLVGAADVDHVASAHPLVAAVEVGREVGPGQVAQVAVARAIDEPRCRESLLAAKGFPAPFFLGRRFRGRRGRDHSRSRPAACRPADPACAPRPSPRPSCPQAGCTCDSRGGA